MTRKSKQAGGNFPLTHYERTKKFASAEYGTTSKRLAGHSQYQLGDCALSLTRLNTTNDSAVLCSPSGYLYSADAILEYLLTKTQEIKEQQAAYDLQEAADQRKEEDDDDNDDGDGESGGKGPGKKRVAAFEETQRAVKKSRGVDTRKVAQAELKRTSYWLADMQPDRVAAPRVEKPPDRPLSPHSQLPLRRKDLWPVRLVWDSDNAGGGDNSRPVCAVSGKPFQASEVTAYWTDSKKKEPGTLVLTTVYDELIGNSQKNDDADAAKKKKPTCPVTSRRVRDTRKLQKSGTGYASSGQQVEVRKYAPTIT